MKKRLFVGCIALLSLSVMAFGQTDTHYLTRLDFVRFIIPATCYDMGLSEKDFADLRVFVDLSGIKDKTHGVPSINSISGVQTSGAKLRFTYLQLNDYYGYMTIPAPFIIHIRGKQFPVSYISMEKKAVVGSTYSGDIRLNAFNSNQVCMLHLLQH